MEKWWSFQQVVVEWLSFHMQENGPELLSDISYKHSNGLVNEIKNYKTLKRQHRK